MQKSRDSIDFGVWGVSSDLQVLEDGQRHRMSLGKIAQTRAVEEAVARWGVDLSGYPPSNVFSLAILQLTHIYSNASAWRELAAEELAQAFTALFNQRVTHTQMTSPPQKLAEHDEPPPPWRNSSFWSKRLQPLRLTVI